MSLDRLLDDFEAGQISRDALKKELLRQSFIETGCAKIDQFRQLRTGGPEVVYCAGKTPDQVASIFDHLNRHNGRALGTKADQAHFEAVRAVADARFDPVSGLLSVGEAPAAPAGKVVVVSAGTSDLSVAEEAAGTAEFLGSRVDRHFDCGVAGIHRLFSVMDELNKASVIIAVAGMEGALPSVIGGMAMPPILAVPTSVGYGASFQGLAALLTMMNSCAPGIGVLNIDNGFGAGYLAHKINVLAIGERNP
ncbi:nickel pincer cofactor biosynthesis protein LarB [Desulfovibrio sp. Huiquan2017]|uniref:nickel pincer cofactor biosynthesis protein LarB n=1 Tax=Desulfovibrio sp. Huiquan2017 TaxID=2816861 RepID=UPI001A918435|nr:nickel pincer cofactor biosynthesis protein LarB [Desulfovibrio sp. Huiquan2017]